MYKSRVRSFICEGALFSLWLRGILPVPARGYTRGHQHLDDFCKNEPVQAKADRQRNGVREHSEPTESAGEEYDLRGHGRQRGPCETA